MSKTIPNNPRAKQYCKQHDFEVNEHGVYLYISQNGHSHIDLCAILHSYGKEIAEETRDEVEDEHEIKQERKTEATPDDFDTTLLNDKMKYDWLVDNFKNITLEQLKTLVP